MISISKTVGKHSVVMKFDRRKIGLVNIYHSTHNTGYLVETARLREHVVESGHLRTAEVTGTISYCSTDRKYTMPLESGMPAGMRNGEKSSEKNTMSPRRQSEAAVRSANNQGPRQRPAKTFNHRFIDSKTKMGFKQALGQFVYW